MKKILRKGLSFLRWRIVAVRYFTMLFNVRWLGCRRNYRPASETASLIYRDGYCRVGAVNGELLRAARELYDPRVGAVIEKSEGAPFVNLLKSIDVSVNNPVMKLAFSTDILDVANDYFGGHFILDSIQVLYSWGSQGAPRESQLWHKDYGDNKSFHAIIYLNDVLDEDGGPFVFVDKLDTTKIKKSPFVRRIADDQFKRELGDGVVRIFLGKAGEMVLVDPAVCYHHGSRCLNSRMAIFVTFSTSMPFVRPQESVRENVPALREVARKLRPDLSRQFVERIISY